jgi:hypothetical protein
MMNDRIVDILRLDWRRQEIYIVAQVVGFGRYFAARRSLHEQRIRITKLLRSPLIPT